MSTQIKILRPGQDSQVEITVEVDGIYQPGQQGGPETEHLPDHYVNITAVVDENAWLDEDETIVGWSVGDPIKLRPDELEKANEALLENTEVHEFI